MNIAVLSDIHGNHIALRKCIEYAVSQDSQAFCFLGDYVGELAYPEKTMELIYDLKSRYPCFYVRGNKEEYWLNYRDKGENGWRDGDSTTGSLLYTYNRLTARDLNFFDELQIAQKLVMEKLPELLICHGSPNKINEKLLPGEESTRRSMDLADTSVILCGHTHIQGRIEHNGKSVWNPGSVGVPLQSGGKAQFMILHGVDREWRPEFISLSYDKEKVIQELHDDGLDRHAPYWCKITENLLSKGNITHGKVLARAMTLCREENGECVWPDIQESYWQRAWQELCEQ